MDAKKRESEQDLAAATPHYHGHRERLRERFREAGADALSDYELLEAVLFRALPRRDAKPLAKTLIATFGSFAEVIAAPRARLAEVKGIVGIKDATSNIERATDLMKRMPKDFLVFSGNDDAALAYVALGAHGVISVTANVAPRLMHEMCAAAAKGDMARAIALNNRLLPLHRHLFVESNPIPAKWALAEMGRIETGIRLPMTALDARFHDTVRAALREAGCQY